MSMPNKNIALQIAKEKKNIEDISRSTHLTTTASVTASATHATPDLSKIDQWDANFRTQFFTRLFNQILDVIEKEEKIPFIIGVANTSKGEILAYKTVDGFNLGGLAAEYNLKKLAAELIKLEEKYFPSTVYNVKNWAEIIWYKFSKFKDFVTKHKINPNYCRKDLDELFFNAGLSWTPDYLQKLEFLINECNADINLKKFASFHNTLLSHYIINERRQAAIGFLKLALKPTTKSRLNPDAWDSNHRTSLMLAIAVGQLDELIELLLDNKEPLQMNLDFQDKAGFTALHIACITRDLNSIILLILHGASIEIRDNRNRRPFDLLEDQHSAEYKILMDSIDINTKRDRHAQSNNILTSYKHMDSFYPIFTLDNMKKIAAKFLNHETELSPTIIQSLAELMSKKRSLFMEFAVLSNTDAKSFTAQQLFVFQREPIAFLRLDKQVCKSERKEIADVLQSFSGKSLEQYALEPARNAAAKRVFAKELLCELQFPSRVAPLLQQFDVFKSKVTQKPQKSSVKPSGKELTIADITSSYLTPTLNQILAQAESSKSKLKRNKKKKAAEASSAAIATTAAASTSTAATAAKANATKK